ncbi:MAG: ABC transporter ATP-binding protein [Planctomycetota bacterium]
MNAIEVQGLGKRYRLGGPQRDDEHLRQALWSLITSPVRNVRWALRKPPEEETFWALRNVSFEVPQGQVLGVIGPNGAGKSTLLKILSRITNPTEGEARLSGRLGSLLEVGTGFHPELTGKENIYLNGTILGMRKQEIDRRYDAIVDFSGVEAFLDTPVKRYSSGMRVRLAFAVAAHLDPEILVIDEVLAVGDAEFQSRCLGKMREVARGGRTVLFVSHNLQAVSHLCDRCLLLEGGNIAADGSVEEAIRTYEQSRVQVTAEMGAHRTFPPEAAKDAQILETTVCDRDGNPKLEFDVLDEVHLKMRFVVRKPFANLLASCQVRGPMGDMILISSESDKPFHDDGVPVLRPRAPGEYTAQTALPAPLLNVGSYQLLFVLMVPNQPRVDWIEDIMIQITERRSFVSALHKRSRIGLLALPLSWSVAYTRSAESDPSTSAFNSRQGRPPA